MTNPLNQRLPFETELADQPHGVQSAHRAAFMGLLDLNQAIASLKTQITTVQTAQKTSSSSSSSSSSSGSSVTTAQATTIANTQAAAVVAQTFGSVNNQTGTAYTVQQSDYAGLITYNNAAATAVTLNNGTTTTVNSQWFSAMENLGAGTVTLTPASGTINGLANLPLTIGEGALVYFDGTNWFAIHIPATGGGAVTALDGITGAVTLVAGSGITITDNSPSAGDITIAASGGGSGVTSLQTETGAITLQSTGATVVITTPSSSTINLEAVSSTNNSGTSPGVSLGGPAGSGATSSVTGNDSYGTIQITAGTGASTGNVATVTLATAFSSTAIALVQGFIDSTAVAVSFAAYPTGSGGSWTLAAGFAMTSGVLYTIRYVAYGN